MVVVKKNELWICIAHHTPLQAKDEIIKAIAAAIRWRANYTDVYKGDDFNLMILSEFLADLTNDA